MSLFEVEQSLPVSEGQIENLDRTFKQIPMRLSIPIPQIRERIVEKHETNYLPYVVFGGLIGLFAFLSFLAYLKKG